MITPIRTPCGGLSSGAVCGSGGTEDALGTGRTQFVIDSRSPFVPAAELLSIDGVSSVSTSASEQEWLSAAEYCLVNDAPAVVFCERGIRSFDPNTRNLLDLGAVALLAHVYRLPVIVDPSHGTGRRDLITPLSRAALAAGATGLMLETHEQPGDALSDGPQAISPLEVGSIARHLHR